MKKGGFLLSLLVLFPFVIQAQSVNIIYESQTYTPPFYLGLPLWSRQSEIKFTAIVTGVSNPKSLYYMWHRDGVNLGLVSGRGIDSLTFSDTIFSKPKTVGVDISTADETIIASASVTLVPQDPQILVYEKNPLYGFMFNNAVTQGYDMKKEEVTFTAFPLSFSTLARDYPLVEYSWGDSSVTYRRGESESGRSRVSLEVISKDLLKQRAEKGFLVTFGDEE